MSSGSSTPALITSANALTALVERLQKHALVAVDTEANSLYAYRERLCLVQFSTPDEDALIDPFPLANLEPLAALFASPTHEKIFHAAEYDLLVMQRQYHLEFANLFDTMMAARILGRKRVGLSSLLEEDFGITLEKRFQRADWGARPLQPALLDYARHDTHYLIPLRNKLKADLEAAGRWPLAQEDFARLPAATRANVHVEDVPEVWRVKGSRDLNPRQAAILQELAEYRAQRAAIADVPLFKIMGDTTLIELAKLAPGTLEEMSEVKGMSEGQLRRHGKALLAAVKRGQDAAPLRRPPRRPYDEAFVERVELLRAWRKHAAKEMDVESDVVLPRDIMESTARANPATRAELAPLFASVPWRLHTWGDQVLKALRPS
ncbi:MAG TPA: HRDC domain-containing protein [Anaerolineales bacterium]|nr:HRDC domain-containing protein [Anaerolineales bacterium]HRQ91892.1 HRDC domain-containing protein [Anaerolineales bacterium]